MQYLKVLARLKKGLKGRNEDEVQTLVNQVALPSARRFVIS